MVEYTVIQDLIGETPVKIEGLQAGSDEIRITFASGRKAEFYHSQDCCESVYVNDVDGDAHDLLYSPLTTAEKATEDNANGGDESSLWTFYRFGTSHGFVVVRWLGESNGYYGVEVSHRVSDVMGEYPSRRW